MKYILEIPSAVNKYSTLQHYHTDPYSYTLAHMKSATTSCIYHTRMFLVFGLLCRHTASNPITSETHTSGAQ